LNQEITDLLEEVKEHWRDITVAGVKTAAAGMVNLQLLGREAKL